MPKRTEKRIIKNRPCVRQSWKKRVLRVLQNPTFSDSVRFLSNPDQILPNFTKVYQILPKLSKFYKFYKIPTKFYKILQFFKNKFCDIRSFDANSNCCILHIFPPNLYPHKVMVDNKFFSFQLLCQVSHVSCHISGVTIHVSGDTCHLRKNTPPQTLPLLTPPLCTVGWYA